MTDMIPRARRRPVQLNAYHRTDGHNRYWHRVSGCPPGLRGCVVCWPGQHDGSGWVNSASRDDGANIRNCRALLGQKDNVADDGEGGGASNEWGTLVRTLRQDG